MTDTTRHEEITKIMRKAMSLKEYLRTPRIGCSEALSRKDKLEIYQNYLDIRSAQDDKRESKIKNRLSDNGQAAYDAICKHRDEVMLVTA